MTRQIHLVFKTHLDIGFTDHAARVRAQYHNQFIPQAIATGEHFYAENPERPEFIWTTGAWLIWDHLHSQDAERVKRLERAIERGLITWHALPFTTHTELMSPALFRAGLSFSQELDQRFGRRTSAAKMTDVPGHTLGMVPILAEAGVNFLHLGVNTASPVPDVPPIFRWRAPGGEEIVVMYQASYGATDFPAGPEIGLSFAHTSDNIGPQSVAQTVEALRHIRNENADAIVSASTLDAFGAEMWQRRADFPVVTEEIGDSWIHGTATDPQKLARFRALQRLYGGWEPGESRRAFGRGLTQVAEHTWGVDIKTYLRDDKAWDRADFEAARKSDYRFAYSEQSWAEQRAYIEAALTELGSCQVAERQGQKPERWRLDRRTRSSDRRHCGARLSRGQASCRQGWCASRLHARKLRLGRAAKASRFLPATPAGMGHSRPRQARPRQGTDGADGSCGARLPGHQWRDQHRYLACCGQRRSGSPRALRDHAARSRRKRRRNHPDPARKTGQPHARSRLLPLHAGKW
jgi:hypothetical protein